MSEDRASDEKVAALPSIMIDPSLTAQDDAAAANEFSAAVADRLADSIRPSWAPSRPPAPTPVRHTQESPDSDYEAEALIGSARRQRRRGLWAVALATATVVVLGGLGLLLSRGPDRPDQAVVPSETSEASAPVPLVDQDPIDQDTSVQAKDVPAPEPSSAASAQADTAAVAPGDSATVEAPEVGSPSEPEVEPPARGTVRFKILTDPRRARLFIEGRRVENPFDGEVPAGREIVIEARARRRQPMRVTARSDRDRTIGVSLKRLRRHRAPPPRRR